MGARPWGTRLSGVQPGAGFELRRAIKSFGERRLLDIDAHTFSAGVLHLIKGDNGVGKSTLLKILAGLERADELEFFFRGVRYTGINYPDALRREIVYVHQHPYLFSTSVGANIRYGLKLRKIPVPVREAAITEAIRWAGLNGIENVTPKRLSGGEKQRVALARALVLNAPVMLIDEPTANLDGKARDLVRVLLESLRAEGRIVLIATHDPVLMTLPGAFLWQLRDGMLTRAVA